MDGRTRVEAALALDIADRPPAAWWGHTFREEWSPEELARVTVERARAFGWDFVKFQPRATCFAEALGSQYEPAVVPLDPPVLVAPAVRMLDDWSWLPKDGADTPALTDQVAAIGRVAGELEPAVPVLQTVFSPITVAGYLLGGVKPRVVRELRKYPRLIADALDRIADMLTVFIARSIEAGAAGIFYAVSGYATAEMMPADDYEAQVLPHDERVLSSLPEGAWFNVLHLCGPSVHFGLAGRLPVQAISWSIHDPGNPSLAEGRDRSGRAVMGGLAHRTTLVTGDPAAVAAEAHAAVEETGGRGLLLAPGCSVPPEAPDANLRAVGDAAGS